MKTALMAALSVLLAAGCHVYAEPEPVTVTAGTYVPADIETYPSYVYAGRTVYLYDDHWWYRDGGHWVYYDRAREPAPLVRQRTYVQQAPPARRYQRANPSVNHGNQPPASAPPATRVQ